MTFHTLLFISLLSVAGLLAGCGTEPAPSSSSAAESIGSTERKELSRKLEQLQKRQREDRDQFTEQISRLQGEVATLKKDLARNEREMRAALSDRVEQPKKQASVTNPASKDDQAASNLAVKSPGTRASNSVPLAQARVRIRGSIQSIRETFLDPAEGATADWFPIKVTQAKLVRKQTGNRLVPRFEKTGETFRNEKGIIEERVVRLEEKIPVYAYHVEVTLENLVKEELSLTLSAGAKKEIQTLASGESQQVEIPALPHSPLVIESGKKNRSFPVQP